MEAYLLSLPLLYFVDQFTVNTRNSDIIVVYRSIWDAMNSNMFVILKDHDALIIDSNNDEDLIPLFKNNRIERVYVILTHEHYDHTFGTPWLQEQFGATLICNKVCAERVAESRRNIPRLVSFVLSQRDLQDGGNRYLEFKKGYKPFTLHADVVYDTPCEFELLGLNIKATQTPGHSPGSWCLVVDDSFVITGDCLIQNTPVLERFKESSSDDYRNITLPFLKGLDENLIVLPGHGDPFVLKDNGILNKY